MELDVALQILGIVVSALVAWRVAKKYGDLAGTNAAIAYEKEKEARDAAKFRQALGVVIDQNLELVIGLQSAFEAHRSADGIKDAPWRRKAARDFAESPLAAWSTEVWASQTPSVLGAISGEIRAVQRLYRELRKITATHENLKGLLQEQNEFSRSPTGGGSGSWLDPPRPFDDKCEGLMEECIEIVEDLRDTGNPIYGYVDDPLESR